MIGVIFGLSIGWLLAQTSALSARDTWLGMDR